VISKYNIIFLAMMISCTSIKPLEESSLGTMDLSPSAISFSTSYEIKPGEVEVIRFPHFWASKPGKLYCRNTEVPYKSIDQELVAYIKEDYFSKMEPFSCIYKTDFDQVIVANIQVTEKTFPSERLNVDLRRVRVSDEDQARVDKEQVFLNSNYARSPSRPYFSKPFLIPLDSLITSIYGARRVFNGEKQTQHLGTDFRAWPGVPIHASNAGRVVVARDLFYTGLTVTIDHGMNIFTIYGHLSKIDAVEGEFVPQGALLGLSGATGRVTGPHLHWGVRVQGDFIDGHSLVRASEKALR
jgi:murein DD-endopeptidase MepM/ murein hydrolase activator NlpD